jgi:hypothetical protein
MIKELNASSSLPKIDELVFGSTIVTDLEESYM